jgi:isopentenyldiphosphate isomerase
MPWIIVASPPETIGSMGVFMTQTPDAWIDQLHEHRMQFSNSESVMQSEIDSGTEVWSPRRDQLCRSGKSELLHVVDCNGVPTGVTAQRWLCHLLGIRHRCVNVLLRWRSQRMGTVLVLQVRSWAKLESPGHVDISVGGHVVGNHQPEETARVEMHEELGITMSDLVGQRLDWRGAYESPAEADSRNVFLNREWRDVYVAELLPDRFDRLQFLDGEVVGLYLTRESEAEQLLNQRTIPFASALKYSLTMCFGE